MVTVPRTAGPGAASDVDRRLASDTVAGDQDAFTHLFHSYRQDVYRVARGVVGSHEAALDVVQEPAHDPRPDMEKAVLLGRLRALADRLEGQQGLILRLRLVGGLSNKEIAGHLGLSEPNTRMQLTKAVRRLREMS